MTTHSPRKTPSERGIILWIFVLSFVFLVLVVGLAIDGGMLYLTRARLQSAGDAAALAAARSLNISLDQADQLTDAQNAATAFFNANFPSNYLLSSGATVTTTIAYGTGNAVHTLSITTRATVNAPTFFMRWFGYTTIPITVTGTASRKDVNLVLLFDISASMNNVQPGTSASACSMMKTDAAYLVGQFSNNRDTVGLVVFNDGVTSTPAVTNFNPSIINTINAVNCTGDTSTAAGLNAAYAQLQSLNQPLKLNAILLETDGWAEAVAADFPVKHAIDSRYGDSANPYNDMGSLYTMPASPCQAGTNSIRGVISENSADNNGPDPTGYTSGPWQWGSAGGWVMAGVPNGCAAGSNFYEFRRDAAYIPTQDIYGNSTVGYRTDYTGPPNYNYVAGQDEFPNGSTYAGQIRPDKPVTCFNVGFNAAESQGITIRNDATLNPMILTIGLGGNDTYPTDAEFLIRLANVPSGPSPSGSTITNTIYSTSQAQGLYVYSPTSNELASSFQKIASFLVELSH